MRKLTFGGRLCQGRGHSRTSAFLPKLLTQLHAAPACPVLQAGWAHQQRLVCPRVCSRHWWACMSSRLPAEALLPMTPLSRARLGLLPCLLASLAHPCTSVHLRTWAGCRGLCPAAEGILSVSPQGQALPKPLSYRLLVCRGRVWAGGRDGQGEPGMHRFLHKISLASPR